MKYDLLNIISSSLDNSDLKEIKKNFSVLLDSVKKNNNSKIILENGHTPVLKEFLLGEINQILETQTIERTKYYIKRLIKSLTETKQSKINDLNLNRWKEYDDIITDSLWILNKRDNSGVHHAGYWGNFIPQIPNQLLRRYTKKAEWILDPFLGSGTTLIEAQRLGRNAVGIELSKKVLDQTKRNVSKEANPNKVKLEFVNGDSASINLRSILSTLQIKAFQFQIFHPPYWDIIKFSESKSDLSNAKSIEEFLKGFGSVLDNCLPMLDKKRYAAVVISDKYSGGEWIPLGFYVMQEVLKRGMILKSTIVKNFDETTAKRNQKELWRYRALAGGFYVFKHEYIFIFQKK
ncbi:MAG TPA: DNA methyltransferase [Ignavibacteriales bacterium]|nr:DNA methyltransferase [Ignavibacteriales bacterium]